MKNFALLLFLGTCGVVHAEGSLNELITRIPSTASEENGIKEAEQKLATQISTYKTEAADLLIPFLRSEDKDVRQLVTYCLVELPQGSLLKKHLPELTEACGKERGWLPNAIAGIDDESALVFLAKDFRKAPEIEAQIDHALIRTSPRSIEPLLKEFEDAGENETAFIETLASIWEGMGESASPAVPRLLVCALDPAAPTYRRLAAIRYLGAIGPCAESSFPQMKQLAESEPLIFQEGVENAIRRSRTAEAAAMLLPAAIAGARGCGELYLFRDLANLGKSAASVGDQLADLLDDPDPNIRLGACRTLGFTTRLDLWPFLVRALKDSDWRVVFAACSSLSHLKAKGADSSLQALAESHWYPWVRHAAVCARFRIKGEKPPETDSKHLGIDDDDGHFFFDFGEGDILLTPMDDAELAFQGIKRSESLPWGNKNDGDSDHPSFLTLHPDLHQAISLSQDVGHWRDACRFVGMVERNNIHLAAFSAGEWGGGLFAVDDQGKATTVLEQNIVALIEWDSRLIALSEVDMGVGAMQEVVFKDGTWTTHFLYALPGRPVWGGLLPDGRLAANCEGGAVAVSKDGAIEYLGSGKPRAGD